MKQLHDELKHLETLIANEPDAVKRAELETRFEKLIGEAREAIRRLPSFRYFERVFKNTLN